MTFLFSVRNAAPFSDSRPLAKSHLRADLEVRGLLRLDVRVVLVVRLRAQREVRVPGRRHRLVPYDT